MSYRSEGLQKILEEIILKKKKNTGTIRKESSKDQNWNGFIKNK